MGSLVNLGGFAGLIGQSLVSLPYCSTKNHYYFSDLGIEPDLCKGELTSTVIPYGGSNLANCKNRKLNVCDLNMRGSPLKLREDAFSRYMSRRDSFKLIKTLIRNHVTFMCNCNKVM